MARSTVWRYDPTSLSEKYGLRALGAVYCGAKLVALLDYRLTKAEQDRFGAAIAALMNAAAPKKKPPSRKKS